MEPRKCPEHGAPLVPLPNVAADLEWCPKCRGARRILEDGHVAERLIIHVDPGPPLCDSCRREGGPCLGCDTRVCLGHSGAFFVGRGPLCRVCYLKVAPAALLTWTRGRAA